MNAPGFLFWKRELPKIIELGLHSPNFEEQAQTLNELGHLKRHALLSFFLSLSVARRICNLSLSQDFSAALPSLFTCIQQL